MIRLYKASENILNSKGFEENLRKVWDGIFDKLPEDYRYQVYHTLYDQFFNEDTDWYNGQTMGIIPGYKPLLDKPLRHKLNRLTESVNGMIQFYAGRYAREKHWFRNRLFTINADRGFDKHRFCEDGSRTPTSEVTASGFLLSDPRMPKWLVHQPFLE